MKKEQRHIDLLIRKNLFRQLFVAAIFLMMGIFTLLFVFMSSLNLFHPYFTLAAGAILLLIGFILSAITVADLSEKKYSASYAIHHCHEVVWIYSYLVIYRPFGIRFFSNALIYFHFINGKSTTLRVPEKELNLAMKQLNTIFPNATFGYSIDKEQLFKANPALLLKV